MTQASRIPRWLGIGALLLAINSAYLAAFSAPSLFYYTNVGFHAAFGALLAIAAAVWLVRRRPARSFASKSAAAILAVGALLGFVVIVTGATRDFRPIVVAHVAVSFVGLFALAPLLLRRPL